MIQCMLFVYTFHLLHCELVWDAIMIFSFLGILDREIHSPTLTILIPGFLESVKPEGGGAEFIYTL